jgi:hypothetical protein
MFDKWEEAGTNVENVRYQASRALSVHPMHEARIHDYVDAEYARRKTAAPTPLNGPSGR